MDTKTFYTCNLTKSSLASKSRREGRKRRRGKKNDGGKIESDAVSEKDGEERKKKRYEESGENRIEIKKRYVIK